MSKEAKTQSLSGVVQTTSLVGKRTRNEDQHDVICDKKSQRCYLAVFDGHGGKDIAIVVKDLLRNKVQKHYDAKMTKAALHRTFRLICDEIQAELIKNHAKKAGRMGTCALANIVTPKQIISINVGDSRTVLCNRYNIAVPLTKDHRPLSYEEYTRIKAANGTIITDRGDDPRINGLSVSRTFGDLDARPEVVHLPDIYFHDYSTHDKFLIVGCDGLWESMSPQNAVDYVLIYCAGRQITNQLDTSNQQNVANQLAKEAIRRGSTDNITCILYWL